MQDSRNGSHRAVVRISQLPPPSPPSSTPHARQITCGIRPASSIPILVPHIPDPNLTSVLRSGGNILQAECAFRPLAPQLIHSSGSREERLNNGSVLRSVPRWFGHGVQVGARGSSMLTSSWLLELMSHLASVRSVTSYNSRTYSAAGREKPETPDSYACLREAPHQH